MIRAALRLFLPVLAGLAVATEAPAQQQQPRSGAGGQSSQASQPKAQGKPAAPAQGAAKPAAQGQAKPTPAAAGAKPRAAAPGGGQAVQSYDDWAVYRTASGPKVCYALATPKSRFPSNLKEVQGYMFVTARPAERVRNEISLVMNFDLKQDVDHQLVIGKDQFVLAAKDRNLWVKNPAQEGRVVEAMKRAGELTVKGTSAKNNATADKYSLKGFGDALERMQKECR